ncbi:hypothetical protein EDB89DRAFT_2232826 [Lactarius sanguifluus]|nr:hypothetical protein EDB89DRAFT_2232826 [Lactarius sanguifluus]
MNSNTSFALSRSNLFSEYLPPADTVSLGIAVATDSWKTHDSNPRSAPLGGDVEQDFGLQDTFHTRDGDQNYAKNNDNPVPILVDLVDEVKGMYRLLDLISESGSDGYVDKVIVAQDSLQHFIDAISPGAYAPITRIDFKTLDRLAIKPLGIYGCKDEIVRLLQSLGAVDTNLARLLLAPSDVGGSQRSLSSGLYILRASAVRSTADERHYVIYWPEDSTWNDSASSSVRCNRVTFMRYLTKICDQVIALLSPDYSASIVWGDEDSDTEPVDIDISGSGRVFKFGVAKTYEQEENAVLRPGFQINSRIIMPYEVPPDCQVDPSIFVPRLLPGETAQALLTAVYVPHQVITETMSQRPYTQEALSQLLKSDALVLSEDLDEGTVQTLVNVALSDLFPEQCKQWQVLKLDIRDISMREQTRKKSAVAQDIANTGGSLRCALREEVVDHVSTLFPSLDRDSLSSPMRVHGNSKLEVENSVRLSDIRLLYPAFESIFQKHVQSAKFDGVLKKSLDFKALELDVLSLWHLQEKHGHLRPETRSALVQALLIEHDYQRALGLPEVADGSANGSSMAPRSVSSFSGSRWAESFKNQMTTTAANLPDSQFLERLESTKDEDLRSVVRSAKTLAQRELSYSIDAAVDEMTHAVLTMQQELCRINIQGEVEKEERKALDDALVKFVREINERSVGRRNSTIYIDRVDVEKKKDHIANYKLTGRLEEHQLPKIRFCVHPMDLTNDDRHNMQLVAKYIPTPTIVDRFSSSFYLPLWAELAFCQLLENQNLLLILASPKRFFVYLERLPVLDVAIQRGKSIKSLNRDRLGQNILFSFDEAKRVLAVCASTRLQLHVFVFDETFKKLQGRGSVIDIAPWYSQPDISILQMTFVCGGEEVALVDSSAQARIFSFVTLQFRPAFIQLQTLPNAIYSSPDGSCLFVLHSHGSGPSLTAYHWETFGSTGGIPLEIPEFPLEGAVLTSMVSRGHVFFLGLDTNSQAVKSVVIDITKEVTEFTLKERGGKHGWDSGTRHTQHNSIVDCHAEVWTRFPVLAAVRRRTITSLSERQRKTLTFIADHHTRPFASYFSYLIHTFETTTLKPTGDELRSIRVSAAQFGSFLDTVVLKSDWKVSRYRVGEWLVDLLCLIPINIAVCRENQFVPLVNGVLSAEIEGSLLGAEINQIVDRLSFGWYESIFQSYFASMPVKVVSSMGPQSVGKSFSLDHLVDTSFDGNPKRTTEGVWMSVTPTDEALIVALEFGGVDSIERSPQENTLLVLFNTAVSNLVLFRNNFASSRDISGLFQSFQSSSSLLDPAVNPTLFQSTLVIIIEDVVEADIIEITREVSLKLKQIVHQEQDANFISRLHGGKLDIIPWPAIGSRDFYELFATLKMQLDLQKVSHPAAGEFLHTTKTLMAKLKASDWGALSHTLAEHRAKSLSALLPFAVATGYSGIGPDSEPLKNFDTDLAVEWDYTAARFAVSDREQLPPNEIEMYHSALLESWNSGTPRQFMPDSEWIEGLASYLNGLINLRVNRVQRWLDSNLERFQGGHAAIEDLRRQFDSLIIDMKTNVQLCRAQCASCHLLCVRSRLHEGEHSCRTTHKCVYNCEICGDFTKLCGLAAGHPGKHVCAVKAHLCGSPCKLLGKRGCLKDCTKATGHAKEHMCSALVHMCGEPCALKDIVLVGRKAFSCHESCSIPSNQEHESHSCEARLCPATCELCKRLCGQPHLHGLIPGTYHLCGEAHSCPALCAAPGICKIDTSPQSIEATFAGKHETFQYTRYTQVASRAQCVQTIPPGLMAHEGGHTHSRDEKGFHFCETRCGNCGYFCTLPLGHSQKEHRTGHGSMAQTRWAVDGPDGVSLELGGRKFSSDDEGAPMMCNLVCSSMGRHVHIDYCCAGANGFCDGVEVQHINGMMVPNPERRKDAITHSLYWRRMGFKDPYTRDEQDDFRKCDAMCPGIEHLATDAAPAQPSYCSLPMFHPPKSTNDPADGLGYISKDGHMFSCENPAELQAFHVIFVIDRSGSMSIDDRRPLPDAPATYRIRKKADNRLGAVYSALYSFWSARHAAVTVTSRQQATDARRDAYSIILFSDTAKYAVVNDFTSTPDQLLDSILNEGADRGTNFAAAIQASQAVMMDNWSTERFVFIYLTALVCLVVHTFTICRTPVIVFLSDGESSIQDMAVVDLCRSAIQHGKPLSFHAVFFGPDGESSSSSSDSDQNSPVSTLRRMVDIAREIQNRAPPDPLLPTAATSFNTALDTVHLAETFLGIAESLRKPRGSLMSL